MIGSDNDGRDERARRLAHRRLLLNIRIRTKLEKDSFEFGPREAGDSMLNAHVLKSIMSSWGSGQEAKIAA